MPGPACTYIEDSARSGTLPWTYRARPPVLCTVRPILMDVQSPIPCSLHGQAYSHGRTEPDPLFSGRSGLDSARSPHSGSEAFTIRTPPFKWTKMFENQTFSTRFTKGSGYGLVSRNCGILDVTISLATVKKWALFFPTSSMHGCLFRALPVKVRPTRRYASPRGMLEKWAFFPPTSTEHGC